MHNFGYGTGRLSKREISRRCEIARRHGARFVIMTGECGTCICGHGCQWGRCPEKKYWFETPEEQFKQHIENAIFAELRTLRKT